MKWPFRKLHDRGKRAVSQRQSHHANICRELRDTNGRGYKRAVERPTEENDG